MSEKKEVLHEGGDEDHQSKESEDVVDKSDKLSVPEIDESTEKAVTESTDQETFFKGNTKKERWIAFLLSLTIEPFMFLFTFAYFSRSVCVTNLILEKICKNTLNISDEICANLTSNTTLKTEVEEMTNDYGLYLNLLIFGPGAFYMAFAGPWSDKYGRKPPLYISILGLLLDDIGVILNTYFFTAPIGYLLLAVVPSSLTGGFVCVLTLTSSMASDNTTRRLRTIKFALVGLSFGLGISLGTLVGGQLYNTKYSYYASFGTCAIVLFVCTLWLVFAIEETCGLDVQISWLDKFKDLFTLQKLKDGYNACMKPRENYGRCQIWMLMSSMCCVVVTYESFASISYMYAFHLYGWNPTKFSNFNSALSLGGLVGGVAAVPILIRKLKLRDAGLGILAIGSMMAKNLFLCVAQYGQWIYFAGNILGIFSGIAPMAIRARLSKVVDSDELGKVFALLSSCESLVPLFGTIAITKLFNATLNDFPGSPYLVGAILLIVPIGTFWWISRLPSIKYQQIKGTQIQEAP